MNYKQVIWSIFLLIALTLMVPGVAAQGITAPPTITIGGSNQEASNPLHDNGPRVVQRQGSITFTNADTANAFKIMLKSINGVTLLDAKYNLRTDLSFSSDIAVIQDLLGSDPNILVVDKNFGKTPLDIPAASSSTLSMETMIPASLDAIDSTFKPTARDVVRLQFEVLDSAGVATGDTIIVDVKMQRENLLEISDADAEVNGKTKTNLDNGDEIKNLKPGDSIDIDVEVSNNFDDSDDVDLNDVNLQLSCDDEKQFDIDDKNLDLGDISPEDDETDTFNIDIDEDADDGSIGCDLEADGIDENGAKHGERISFDMDIKRESHDIQIRLPIITSPQVISCDDSTLQMTVNFLNLGKSNERNIAVEVTSTDANFQQRSSNIELDENDAEVEIFEIPLEKLAAKSPVTFTVRTFYDNVKSSNTEVVLVENTCVQQKPQEQTTTPEVARPSGRGTLILGESIVATTAGKFNSLGVQITSNEQFPIAFEVSLADISEFATSSASKTITLQPGQTSTVFLNFKTKADVDAGTYTGTVNLKSGGQVVDSQLFTVEIAGEQKSSGVGISFDNAKVFWIIGDVILIILAIFFIRLIFVGGRRRPKEKKMADFEAAAAQRRRR